MLVEEEEIWREAKETLGSEGESVCEGEDVGVVSHCICVLAIYIWIYIRFCYPAEWSISF